ncbi:MAG: hypothetical protein HYV36_03395, partial [Lentisphaerae bacterium]|nr:hypothetical protein [Lentisphaerota bacterium]
AMSLNVNWSNPYAQREGVWRRGNLHTHTAPGSPCAQMLLARALELYRRAGCDFLGISDHGIVTRAPDHALTIISGTEWNSPHGEHVNIYAGDPADIPAAALWSPVNAVTALVELLARLASCDVLVVLNHPNIDLEPHYSRKKLAEVQPYDGIEIFNGLVRRCCGSPLATEKWDYVLSKNRRVLGLAVDDAHREDDIGAGYIQVRSRGNSPAEIMAAIRGGNFYCSTGVTIADILRENNTVRIDTLDGQEIQAIGFGGRLFQTVRGRCCSCDLAGIESAYLRFAVYGEGSAMAWTQPFFRE